MNKKETIETQLDCKATAALQESIATDLEKEDKSLSDILKKDSKNVHSNRNC
jgi:hypothetical protein